MAQSTVLDEFVVKLSAVVDNQGIQSMLRLLDSSRLKAMGLAAAFSGITTAAYKFIKSAAETEEQLRKTAEQQKKTTETVRASENALSAMGKTLKEVNADKELKKTYNELVEINKALEMPNIDSAVSAVKELRSAFWQLKDMAKYAVDIIGARVLANLEAPIRRITEKFGDISSWIRSNLNGVTIKIASGITAFSKGIIGVGKGISSIVEMITNMDPKIRNLALAVAAVYAVIKSGPLGQILALVTLIGDIIHDADVYKYNLEHGFKEGDKGFVGVALQGIWEQVFDEEGKIDWAGLGTSIMDKITEGLTNYWGDEEGLGAIGRIFNGEDGQSGLLGGIIDFFETNQDRVKALGESIVTFVKNSILAVGGPTGGFFGQLMEQLLGEGTVNDQVMTGGKTGVTFLGSLAGGIGAIFKGIENNQSFWEIVKEAAGGSIMGMLFSGLFANIEKEPDGGFRVDWDNFSTDIEATGKTLLTMVTRGIQAAGKFAGDFALDIVDVLFGENVLSQNVRDSEETFAGTMAGVVAGFINGLGENQNFIDGLRGGIKGGLLGMIIGAVLENTETDANGKTDFAKVDWSGVLGDMKQVGQGIAAALGAGIEAYDGFMADLFTSIGRAIKGKDNDNYASFSNLIGGLFESIGQSEIVGSAISEGLGAGLLTGNIGVGIFSAIAAALRKAATTENGFAVLVDELDQFWNGAWQTVVKRNADGTVTNEKRRVKGTGFWENLKALWFGDENGNEGLKGIVDDIWYGEDGNGGLSKTLSDTWDKVWGAVTDWWNGKEWDEGSGRDRMHRKSEGFKDRLLNLMGFGKQGSGIFDGIMEWWNGPDGKEKISATLHNLWDDIWLGLEDKKQNNKRHGGIKEWLFGDNKWEFGDAIEGGQLKGILDWFGSMFDQIVSLASTAGSSVWNAFYTALYNSLDGNLVQDLLTKIFGNPNVGNQKIWTDSDGNTWFKGRSGESVQIDPERAEKYAQLLAQADYKNNHWEGLWGSGLEKKLGDSNSVFARAMRGEVLDVYDIEALDNMLASLLEDNPDSPKVTIEKEEQEEKAETPEQRLQGRNREKKYGEGKGITSADADNPDELNTFGASDMGLSMTEEGVEQLQSGHAAMEELVTAAGEASSKIEDISDAADDTSDSMEDAKGYTEEFGAAMASANEHMEAGIENVEKLTEKTEELAGTLNEESTLMLNTGDAEAAIASIEQSLAMERWMDVTANLNSQAVDSYQPADKFGTVFYKVVVQNGGLDLPGGGMVVFGDGGKAAMGGRFDREMNNMTVGEDGTEYIIPITKPARARELIRQMFSEMGSSMLSQVLGDLGIGSSFGGAGGAIGSDAGAPDLSSLMSSILDAGKSMMNQMAGDLGVGAGGGGSFADLSSALSAAGNVTTNNNISAPCNIYVTASGVAAESVGERAYNAAQRQQLRMLKGVFA